VKIKSTLIVLLFLFLHGSTQAQKSKSVTESNNQKQTLQKPVRVLSPIDSINPKRLVKANSIVNEPKQQAETSNHIPQNKVINQLTSVPIKTYSSSELKELSNSYWRTQAEIKEAKSQNNLVLLEELEINSRNYRLNYISVFENLEETNASIEQEKLYHSFKKDFNNE
jgi:hypothetical protein